MKKKVLKYSFLSLHVLSWCFFIVYIISFIIFDDLIYLKLTYCLLIIAAVFMGLYNALEVEE
jgi:hypothetical protein